MLVSQDYRELSNPRILFFGKPVLTVGEILVLKPRCKVGQRFAETNSGCGNGHITGHIVDWPVVSVVIQVDCSYALDGVAHLEEARVIRVKLNTLPYSYRASEGTDCYRMDGQLLEVSVHIIMEYIPSKIVVVGHVTKTKGIA